MEHKLSHGGMIEAKNFFSPLVRCGFYLKFILSKLMLVLFKGPTMLELNIKDYVLRNWTSSRLDR